jgi:flagellar basal-body rod modification protein FlgD
MNVSNNTGILTQSAATEGNGAQASAAAARDSLADKDAFLQLLIAQIKNQDPLNPADGLQFLTQLAQFSQLEQLMGIRSELQGLRNDPAPDSGAAGAPGA